MKKNILVGQSGGPTAVIDAGLYGVITEGTARSEEVDHVYGMVNGIEDFLSDHVMDLSSLTHEDLILLKQTPAAYLDSCRFELPENLDAPVYGLLFEKFKPMNIGACLYIGGNDFMDTVDELSRCAQIRRGSISFIGVPKTIDNNLPVADHTPGYGNAAKYVASTVREISLDTFVYQQPAVAIVELIGHHASWVAAAAALTRKFPSDGPPLVYMPEVPFFMEQFFKNVEQALPHQPNMVIYVSEGICNGDGHFIYEYTNDAQVDTFGHEMLTGYTKVLEGYVHNRFRVRVRSVELSVDQRCSSLLASAADVQEAESSSRTAVEKALQGETGRMVTCSRLSRSEYELEYGLTEVGDVCNREESFPVGWIAVEGFGIGPEFLDYALPLIQGRPDHITENGLPKYLCRK